MSEEHIGERMKAVTVYELMLMKELRVALTGQNTALLEALQEIADNCETFAKADNMAGRLHNIAQTAIKRAGD